MRLLGRPLVWMGLLVLAAGCSSKTSAEQKFWQWFEKSSKKLFSFEEDAKAVFDELDAELKKVDPGLTFEFGPVENGKREFIVSAGGIKAVIPAVQRLVAAAPKMPQWTIIAFRQPKDLGLRIKMGDREMGAEDFWFAHKKSGAKWDIGLYIKGYEPDNRDPYLQIAFLFLDIAIGEYQVATRLGAIDFLVLPEDPAGKGLKPLTDLPKVVGGQK